MCNDNSHWKYATETHQNDLSFLHAMSPFYPPRSFGVIGWLNKAMKSKAEWFMTPIGWLMTSCCRCFYEALRDQSIHHISPDSTERAFFNRRLITLEATDNHCHHKVRKRRLTLVLTDSAHFTRSARTPLPKVKDPLCAKASVKHMSQL